MAGPINGNRFTAEQIFKMIDKNGNSVIDESDDIALAQMFGLKSGDKKIDLSKQGVDEKITVFSSVVYKNNSVSIDGNNNNTIVIHGNNNNADIVIPEAQSEIFVPQDNEFSDEAKLAMMKKGLDPEQIKQSGFDTVEQKVLEDNSVQLILRSKDGYNLTIDDFQENPNIQRDANGNLLLDGVRGKLVITPSTEKSHEVVLTNIYEDNIDVPMLEIENKSGVPLTKTYIADETGYLSYDAAQALRDSGFPESEAHRAGFTQVSVTENPLSGERNIHMTSSKHGFVMDVNGNATQSQDMEMVYNARNNKLMFENLSNAHIYITDDGASSHSIEFNSANQVHVENSTNRPVHIKETVRRDEDGKAKNDKSSFEYTTKTNYDTFKRQYTQDLVTHVHSNGIRVSTGRIDIGGCACHGRKTWVMGHKQVGGFDATIDWGTITKTADEIKLAPGSFVIQPKRDDYSKEQKVVKLREGREGAIGSLTMRDYVNARLEIEAKQKEAGDNPITLSENTKMGRAGRSFAGLGLSTADNGVQIKGDNNNTIVIFGDNNVARIAPKSNGRMSDDAKTILTDTFNIDADMFDKAGFNDVGFVRNDKGDITDIIFTNQDGTKLTMPADEAVVFSEQMSIRKDVKGVYHVSGLVGTFEGNGMKIDCTDSNVDLSIIEHNSKEGRLVYSSTDKNNDTPDGIHINYTTSDGSPANVYSKDAEGKLWRKGYVKQTKEYSSTLDITYPYKQDVNTKTKTRILT